ncbi:uromodulin-like [Lissotriton helveticus]
MRRPEMSLLLGVLLAALLGEAGAVTCFAGNSSVPLCAATGCNGGCTFGAGCYCGDGTACLTRSACDPVHTQCCPVGLFWYSDLSCCSEELNCEPACADDEVCTSNAGIAVCTCNETTYLHANRSEIVPTVQCESSQMTVSLKKCLLERFKYSIPDMHFTNTSDVFCTGPSFEELVGGERWVKAQAVPQAGFCGNEMMINTVDKKLVFSNVLFVPSDTPSGLVISSTLQIGFSCTFNMTMQTSLQTVLHPIIGTVTLPSVNGSGPITVTMAAYMSNAFTDPYTESKELTVGTPLYIGISTTFSDADVFSLRADKCVASPSSSPSEPGVPLISNGCPVTEDVDVQIIHNGDSLQVMFQIETFAFQDMSAVYMSCDISLCKKATPNTCGCSTSRSVDPSTVTVRMPAIGISANFDLSSGSPADFSLWTVLGSSLLALLSLKMI